MTKSAALSKQSRNIIVKMKNIVIIGANDFQLPLILEAKKRGYTTHVFAWECGDIGEKEADYFYPISIVEIDQIYEECLKIKPDAICSIASDLAAVSVNELSRRLSLPCNDLKCVKNTTNKYAMRQALKKAGLPTPSFKVVASSKETVEFAFPVIVKPTDRSGSRGIFKVENSDQLSDAIDQAIDYSFEKKAMIEEYIEGPEYSVEAFAFQGEYHLLTFTKKYTTGAPHFIETAHLQPSDLNEETQHAITLELFKAFKALNIQNSAIHGEFRLTKEGMRIIEIGARMGGDCIGSHLVQLSTGYNFVGCVLDIALGIRPKPQKKQPPKVALIHFIFNDEDLKLLEDIKKTKPHWIEKIYIDEHPSANIVDSSSRHGYFILKCDRKDQLKGILTHENKAKI